MAPRGAQPVDSTSQQADNPFAGQGIFYDEQSTPSSEQEGNSDSLTTPWDVLAPGPIHKDTELSGVGLPMPESFDDSTEGMLGGTATDETAEVISGAKADEIAQNLNTLPPGISAQKTTKEAVNWAYRDGRENYENYKDDPGALWDRMTEDKRKYQRGANVTVDPEGDA